MGHGRWDGRRPGTAPAGRLAAALAAAAVLAGCAGGPAADGTASRPGGDPATAAAPVDVPTVVATTAILGDIVGALAGDDAAVAVLMPAGTDPHDFQLSAAAAATLSDADLVVANGLGLEASLTAALDAARAEGVPVLEVAPGLDPLPYAAGHAHDHGDDHGDEAGDDHDHGDDAVPGDETADGTDPAADASALDPHVWWDAERMARGIRDIAAALAALPGIDVDALTARTDAYLVELAAVDATVAEAFASLPADRRRLVTNHDALGYLAARYDLEVIGTIVPGSSTQAAVDAASFAALVETIEEAGVRVVFAEGTDSRALADQLASEVVGRGDLEVEVVTLLTDTLGPPGSGADTYLGLLATTARTIADALAR